MPAAGGAWGKPAAAAKAKPAAAAPKPKPKHSGQQEAGGSASNISAVFKVAGVSSRAGAGATVLGAAGGSGGGGATGNSMAQNVAEGVLARNLRLKSAFTGLTETAVAGAAAERPTTVWPANLRKVSRISLYA